MIEKITLDMLNENSVSLKKQKYVEENGELYEVGKPWRRAYINSTSGRQQIQEEVPEPYKSVIFMVWGDKPTIVESDV